MCSSRPRAGLLALGRHAEAGEPHKIGVKGDPLDATDAKWGKAVLVLQASELALDGSAATVEGAPPL